MNASQRTAKAGTSFLEERPFTPINVDLFSPLAYPDASPMVPAAGPPPTEAEVRIMLADYLADEFPNEPNRQAEGMALFDNPDLIAKIPNPTLRAGLIGLMGTAGEPGIEYLLNARTEAGLPKVEVVGFDDSPWDSTDPAIARAIINDSGQLSYVFNPKYVSENPFLFSSVHAHELLHSDTVVTTTEEVTALALQTYIYLEQLIDHPDLAISTTELARRTNTNALARLNSGEDDSLGLFQSNDDGSILPGSQIAAMSWFGQFENTPGFADTPGDELLRAYLANIADRGSVVPANPDFDMETLAFIDQNSEKLAQELASNDGLRLFDALELANVAVGTLRAEKMNGTPIMDHLNGLGGNDSLIGLDGDDILDGGNDKDHIEGGTGNDDLWGGSGADTFAFVANGSADVIHDFDPAAGDRIKLDGRLRNLDFEMTDDEAGVRIAFEDGTVVTVADFSAQDFGMLDNVLTP